MSIEKDSFLTEHILFCPFSQSCILPQTEVICNFPCYKVCSEYQLKKSHLREKYHDLY